MGLLCASLAACSSIQTQEQKIAVGCATVSASIRVLAVANDNGKIDPLQRVMIGNAIDLVTPICAAEKAPTLDSLSLEKFASAVTTLQGMAVRYE